ncbi:MAG: Hsp20/alpha crystallin family protein [Candidatus Portnoybacteria bacterium]
MPIKWQPFKDSGRGPHLPEVFEEDDWMPFVPSFRREELTIDIYQDKNNLYVEFPLIGVKAKDVSISIENNVLIIQGKAKEKKQIKEENYLRKEIRRGSFRRAVKLPVEVKGNKADAETIDGMLKITIPKVSKGASKISKVPIKIR